MYETEYLTLNHYLCSTVLEQEMFQRGKIEMDNFKLWIEINRDNIFKP